MDKTVLALFGITLVSALITLLIPGEEKEGMGRLLRLFTALAVLLMILTPFLRFLRSDPSIEWGGLVGDSVEEDYEQVFRETVDARGAVDLAAGLSRLVCEEFHLSEDAVLVQVTQNADGDITKVKLTLSGKGLLQDPAEVASYVRGMMDCEVEVR